MLQLCLSRAPSPSPCSRDASPHLRPLVLTSSICRNVTPSTLTPPFSPSFLFVRDENAWSSLHLLFTYSLALLNFHLFMVLGFSCTAEQQLPSPFRPLPLSLHSLLGLVPCPFVVILMHPSIHLILRSVVVQGPTSTPILLTTYLSHYR